MGKTLVSETSVGLGFIPQDSLPFGILSPVFRLILISHLEAKDITPPNDK